MGKTAVKLIGITQKVYHTNFDARRSTKNLIFTIKIEQIGGEINQEK